MSRLALAVRALRRRVPRAVDARREAARNDPRAVLDAFRALEPAAERGRVARRREPRPPSVARRSAGSIEACRLRSVGALGRPRVAALRGRGAAARPGSLHRRHRAGPARAPRRDRPLAVRARADRLGRRRRPRSSCRACSACSPARTSPRCRGRSRPAIESGVPAYAAAGDRPLRRASRWLSSSRSRGTSPRTPPSSSLVDYDPLDPSRSARFTSASSRYGAVDAAFEAADVVVAGSLRLPALDLQRRSSASA